jgi:hypothetical protein
LDEEEKTIKSKAEAYNKMLQTDDHRLTEDGKRLNKFFEN